MKTIRQGSSEAHVQDWMQQDAGSPVLMLHVCESREVLKLETMGNTVHSTAPAWL